MILIFFLFSDLFQFFSHDQINFQATENVISNWSKYEHFLKYYWTGSARFVIFNSWLSDVLIAPNCEDPTLDVWAESVGFEVSLFSDLLLDLNLGVPTSEVTLACAFERYENNNPRDTNTGGVIKKQKNTIGWIGTWPYLYVFISLRIVLALVFLQECCCAIINRDDNIWKTHKKYHAIAKYQHILMKLFQFLIVSIIWSTASKCRCRHERR